MVNFRSITDKAKELVEKRGGTESLKQDAAELKDIATGEGSIKDKAKAAVDAVKDPGGEGEETPPAGEASEKPPAGEGDAKPPAGEGGGPRRDSA